MITRRGFLGLALATIPGVKLLANPWTEPEEEYEIGHAGFEPLVVKVWWNGRITVFKGSEQLVRTISSEWMLFRGWLEFCGKYGTKIALRRRISGELDVAYFAIVEPNGPDVEDVDYLANGQYGPIGFPCSA
jgi:hypothetical protein